MRSRRIKLLLPLAAAGVIGLVVASLPALASAKDPGSAPSDRKPASVAQAAGRVRPHRRGDPRAHHERADVVLHRRGHGRPPRGVHRRSQHQPASLPAHRVRTDDTRRAGRSDHLGRAQRPRSVPAGPSLGYNDYNNEVLAVLDHLGVEDFSILAISGGGAYAAHLAAAVPDRVTSLHAAAAVSSSLPTRAAPNCSPTLEQRNAANMFWKRNPMAWWGVPGSPVLVIPGWQATAYLDGVRAFFMAGQLDDATAMSLPGILACSPGAVADTAKITAPTYLYWGGSDTSVPRA